MKTEIKSLKPERLWHYFAEILEIPRPSKKEEKIIDYLIDFGKKQGLETIKDQIGNILIRKPGTKGREKDKVVVLQSHIDMVCEKNSDKIHDFDNDPIEAWIDGEWVKAKGTTLGADDGIGIAAQLALLESNNVEHGPIECLFTVDEETGLSGAFALGSDFLKGRILLNLDSEDDGQLFIGCAGGKDTAIELAFTKENIPVGFSPFKISVSGLIGGHSGDDINKGRGNANKILNRFLWESYEKFEIRIADFNGGNLRNAIAREAFAIVLVPENQAETLSASLKSYRTLIKKEFQTNEPDLEIAIKKTEKPPFVIDKETQFKLLNSLYACPHGVIAMSPDIPNFVETSTNLASVKFLEDIILITTSQRSSVESAKEDICQMVRSVFLLTGAKVEHGDGYPGWTPNPKSEVMEITRDSFKDLFGEEPEVLAIHAGLECGLIGEKYPGIDMISFGPTIKGAHSPDERLKIDTVERFWKLTLEVLKRIR